MNQPHTGHDQRQTGEPPAAARRLATVLGWEHVPHLSDEEIQDADAKLDAAQAEARRVYGLDQAA